MPTITSLNDIKSTRFQLLGSVDDHLNYLRRECRLVLLSNHIGRRNMAPSSVCLRAGVDSKALVSELRSPLISFGRGEIIIEDRFRILRPDVYYPFLDG